ncbi:MAG: prepilin-type N-terminal cleavage/methylation domain-containing protein [Verrucomicrobium sp.]|nr:prepilin-type N-terminal cleavage/methylation domain-containing protein [Verrucomicrobium sp.]
MRTPAARSFTLIEVLVAMTVLCLMLGMLFSMTKGISDAYSRGKSGTQNDSTARGVLDAIALDLEGAVIRPDLPGFQAEGNGLLDFFTAQPGFSAAFSNPRNLSYVAYGLDVTSTNSDMVRYDIAVDWTTANLAALASSQSFHTNRLAPSVLCFNYRFILTNGQAVSTVSNAQQVAAVRVSLAAADTATFARLARAGRVRNVRDALANAVEAEGTVSAKSVWESQGFSSSFNTMFPGVLQGTGIRFFERTIPVPVSGLSTN